MVVRDKADRCRVFKALRGANMIMKRFLSVILLGFLLPSAATLAECTKTAVDEVLTRNGYTFEYTGDLESTKSSAFLITKDGSKLRMFADLDGDLSFRKYFKNNLDVSNDDAASVMENLKYVQVYIDSDGDIVMAYDVALWGEMRCNFDLSEHLRFFIDLADAAEDQLSE